MPTNREFKAEVDRLKKQLRENEELLHKTAIKIENMEGARDSLKQTLDEIKKRRR